MISDSAVFKEVVASSLLPFSMADSTFLMNVRMRLLRSVLVSVRRAILRVAIFADFVLAI